MRGSKDPCKQIMSPLLIAKAVCLVQNIWLLSALESFSVFLEKSTSFSLQETHENAR